MALLFVDSFDHYGTDEISSKWTGAFTVPTIAAGAGRCSTNAMRMDTFTMVTKGLLFGSARGTVGFAFRIDSAETGLGDITLVRFSNATQHHVGLTRLTDGSLYVFNDTNTPVALGITAPGLVNMDTWYFLELQALIAGSGEVIVRLNDIEVLTVTGVNTVGDEADGSPTLAILTRVSFWCSSNQAWWLDDVYVLDSTGATPANDFLGDCRVEYLRPRAAGSDQDWTLAGAASHWQAVDDAAAPDEDTSYIESVTVGQTDTQLYQLTGLPAGPIFGAQLNLYVRKSEIGPRTIAPVVNGVTGSPIVGASAEDYQYFPKVYATNPATGVAWTIAEINAAEFGVTVVS